MDNASMFFVVIIGILILGIFAMLIFQYVKSEDNKKKVEYKYGKIIEKPQPQSSMVYWVTVDFKDGDRRKMRIFDQNIILAVGDEGMVSYQGQTIIRFDRSNV